MPEEKTAPAIEPGPAQSDETAPPIDMAARNARIRKRNRMVAVALVVFCAAAFAWFLIGYALR